MSSGKKRFGRTRRLLRRLAKFCVVVLLGVVLFRNVIVRTATEIVGSSLLDSKVSVGWVHLSLMGIRIGDVVVDTGSPLLEVGEVQANFSLGDGFRRGVWADQLTIVRPKVMAAFDESGRLLTRLPKLPESDSNSSGATTIPVRRCRIVDAAVAVSQTGFETVYLDRICAEVQCGDEIKIRTEVPDLLGGQCRLDGKLDASSFAGEIRIAVEDLQLTKAALSKLALVGPSLSAVPDFDAGCALEVVASIPAQPNSPLELGGDVECRVAAFNVPDHGFSASDLVASVSLSDRQLKLKFEGEILQGGVQVAGLMCVAEQPTMQEPFEFADIEWTITDVGLRPIVDRLSPPRPISALLGTRGTLNVRRNDDGFRVESLSATSVSGIDVGGLVCSPIEVDASLLGNVTLAEGMPKLGAGLVRVAAKSDGVDAGELTSQLGPILASLDPAAGRDFQPLLDRFNSAPADGRISFAAEADIPFAAIEDPSQITAQASVTSGRFCIAGLDIDQVDFHASVDRGAGRVELKPMRVTDTVFQQSATCSLNASAPLNAGGSIEMRGEVTDVSLATAGVLCCLPEGTIDGTISGWLTASAPIRSLPDTSLIVASGQIGAPAITIFGESIQGSELQCSLKDNVAEVHRVYAKWRNAELNAKAALGLNEPYRCGAKISVGDVDLRQVSGVLERLGLASIETEGKARFSGSVLGDVASKSFEGDGDVDLIGLKVSERSLGDQNLKWTATSDQFTVLSGEGAFLGGELELAALYELIPFDLHAIQSKIRNVQIAGVNQLADLPVTVVGTVDGDAHFAHPLQPDRTSGTLEFRTQQVHVDGFPVDSLSGSVNVSAKGANFAFQAGALGSTCRVDAEADLADVDVYRQLIADPSAIASRLPVTGRMSIEQVSVARLRGVADSLPGRPQIPRELNGFVDVQLSRTADVARAGNLVEGDVVCRGVSWENVVLCPKLLAKWRLNPAFAEVTEISGQVADGRISGGAFATLGPVPDGSFRLAMSRMNLAKLAVPLKQRDARIGGSVDLQVDGRLGRKIVGRANVAVDRASAFGLSLTKARVPVNWHFDTWSNEASVRTSATQLDVAGGRVYANADCRWNGRLDLDLTARAQSVDTAKLMSRSGAGAGVVSGKVQLRGRSAQSINDLSGTFQARIKDAKAVEMPAFDQMVKLLGTISRTTSFDDGTVKGRLANGVVTVDQFHLMASDIRVVVDGTASLAGRLNLNAAAYISESGPADRLIEFANSPIMLATPAPVAVLVKVNDALKDKTIFVNVGGSAAHPVITPRPGRMLGQNAVQFLISSAMDYSPLNNPTMTR